MQMDEGLDTGPVYARHALNLTETETAGTLSERIATLAAHVVRADLAAAVDGKLEASPQDASLATHAPLIERQHLQIDWSRSALEVSRLIRGMAPRPGAFTLLGGKVLRLHEARPLPAPMPPGAAPGTVSILGKRAVVATGSGTLELVNAQLEGKKALMAVDLINGRVLTEGLVLGN
jgi:methionyl-tRNA formyltransferase